ncbi:hypothetical protein KAU88_08105 [Candidatus Bathyarchaeota archaeon]|nr:hypothetical protein [Candidatus Bathyarchaeota archaeon]
MDEQSRYYTLLRDPARRKTIEILGEQEKIGFKELKQLLGLETIPTLITPGLLLLLVGTASIITLAVLAVRWKRRTVNIVGTQ